MPRRKFDTTQRGISDTHTDAPIATSICENKLAYAERIRILMIVHSYYEAHYSL